MCANGKGDIRRHRATGVLRPILRYDVTWSRVLETSIRCWVPARRSVPLTSGGEPDFLFRVLRAGLKVVNAREVVVDHFGVRAPGRESKKLTRGYASGTGAAFWKHVRLGDTAALGLYLSFVGDSARAVCRNLIRDKRPQGLAFLLSFVAGSLKSYQFRVDRESRQYVPRSRSQLRRLKTG